MVKLKSIIIQIFINSIKTNILKFLVVTDLQPVWSWMILKRAFFRCNYKGNKKTLTAKRQFFALSATNRCIKENVPMQNYIPGPNVTELLNHNSNVLEKLEQRVENRFAVSDKCKFWYIRGRWLGQNISQTIISLFLSCPIEPVPA